MKPLSNLSKMSKKTAISVALAGGLLAGLFSPVRAQDLGSILKGGAILIVIDKFGPEIDRFVNKLLGDGSREVGADTKVVPVLSIGRGTYVGAVQITGPTRQVAQVRAVAQVEGQAKIGFNIRVKGLIPVSDRSVKDLTSLKRVSGIGITGIIDGKL